MDTERTQQKLEMEKARLESEMGHLGRKNPAVPGDWEPVPPETAVESDPADKAEEIMQNENNAAILADLEARYDTILSALAKIEKGAYGLCEVCGSVIEEKHLEADPAARTCLKHLA